MIKVGAWRLNQSGSRIDNTNKQIQLTPQQLALLTSFINAPENTLSKEDLIREVWHERIVTDDAITRAISELRKQLSQDNTEQAYIKTLHGFGYQLIAPIQDQRVTRKFHIILLLLFVLLSFIGWWIVKEPSNKTLKSWPIVLNAHHINLKSQQNYIASTAEVLVFTRAENSGVSIYRHIENRVERLFHSKGRIEDLISSPKGGNLAFVNLDEGCNIYKINLANKKPELLASCTKSSNYGLSWIDEKALLFGQVSNDNHLVLIQFSLNSRPVTQSIEATNCLEVKHVAVGPEQRIYVVCRKNQGDELYKIVNNSLESILKYRSIDKFLLDNDGVIYLLHSPSWKTGITRYDPISNSFAFAKTGWIADFAINNGRIFLVRDLSNSDLKSLSLNDLNQKMLENSNVKSLAFSVDKQTGNLWQIDDRGGTLAIFRNNELKYSQKEFLLNLQELVAFQVLEKEHRLILTISKEQGYQHSLYDIQQSATLIRVIDSSSELLKVDHSKLYYRNKTEENKYFDLNTGSVHSTTKQLFPEENQDECLGSPIELKETKVHIYPVVQGAHFVEVLSSNNEIVREWNDINLSDACGLSQIQYDPHLNRLLYLVKNRKYKDISSLDLKVNSLN